MLLILSNSQDATTNYLAEQLGKKGVSFIRLDTDTIVTDATFHYQIGIPRLSIAGNQYTPDKFSNVWNRRPERLRYSSVEESPERKLALDEWTEVLEAFLAHIPVNRWMNHPSVNVAASHKLNQLTTAAKIGFVVPKTLVTQDKDRLHQFFDECRGKIITKPMSSGYIKRRDSENDSLIYTNPVPKDALSDLSDLENCPTLFQEFVQKIADVRITIVDQEIHAIELKALESDGSQRCDVRRNNMDDVVYREISLPLKIETTLRTIMRHYGLRFGAIDMATTTNGEWVFFEINPNGQWAWLDLVGAANIAGSFTRSFANS